MHFEMLVLFGIPLCSSMLIFVLPQLSRTFSKLLLVFSGSYLFSFMLIDLLPDLFQKALQNNISLHFVGGGLLFGFYLQIFLDFFSRGIAHGHLHTHKRLTFSPSTKSMTLLTALCIHALLDGLLLDGQSHMKACLLGIVLHKIPISFALTVILMSLGHKKGVVVAYLFLFCIASPIGWAVRSHLQDVLDAKELTLIESIAIGSLLHVATTILFESNPDHHCNVKKLLVISVGILFAFCITFLDVM